MIFFVLLFKLVKQLGSSLWNYFKPINQAAQKQPEHDDVIPEKQPQNKAVASKKQPELKVVAPKKQPERKIVTTPKTQLERKIVTTPKTQPKRKIVTTPKTQTQRKVVTPRKTQSERRIVTPLKTQPERKIVTPPKKQPERKVVAPKKQPERKVVTPRKIPPKHEDFIFEKKPRQPIAKLKIFDNTPQSGAASAEKEAQSLHQRLLQFYRVEGREVCDRLLAPFLKGNYHPWFDDALINEFMIFLTKQFSSTSCNITHIDSTLRDKSTFEEYLSDLKTKEKTTFKRTRERLTSANLIFYPIQSVTAQGGKHWYLIIIEKKSANHYLIQALDGFNSKTQHPPFFAEVKKIMIAATQNENLSFETRSLNIPRQRGVNDCGPLVCFAAYQMAKNALSENPFAKWDPKKYSPCDYEPARLFIAQKLLAWKEAERQQKDQQKDKETPKSAQPALLTQYKASAEEQKNTRKTQNKSASVEILSAAPDKPAAKKEQNTTTPKSQIKDPKPVPGTFGRSHRDRGSVRL
ncbi:MAG: Ulp1 family isopeptidase [Candidatus Berkiellales bacterium]